MPTHSQLLVEISRIQEFQSGRSGTTQLQRAFPGSPIYSGELTDQVLREQFVNLVQTGPVNDGGHTFGEQDLNYTQAPNMDDVVTGGGGLPGTPFAPNVASPEEGQDPTTIPAVGAEVTEAIQGGLAPFSGDGLQSPSASSKNVSAQTIGSLRFGSSTPQS